MKTKQCNACKEIKSVKEFYKHSKNVDGLYHHCKLCHKLTPEERKLLSLKTVSEKAEDFDEVRSMGVVPNAVLYQYRSTGKVDKVPERRMGKKLCHRCGDYYPETEAYFKPGSNYCRGCVYVKPDEGNKDA